MAIGGRQLGRPAVVDGLDVVELPAVPAQRVDAPASRHSGVEESGCFLQGRKVGVGCPHGMKDVGRLGRSRPGPVNLELCRPREGLRTVREHHLVTYLPVAPKLTVLTQPGCHVWHSAVRWAGVCWRTTALFVRWFPCPPER